MDIGKTIDKLEKVYEGYNRNEIIFLSLGKPDMKAVVKIVNKRNKPKRKIIKLIEEFKKRTGKNPKWIKLDFVTKYEMVDFNIIKKDLIETRRNYIDYGIALDSNWDIAFLAEEINANAFIRPSQDKKTFILSENNINNYLKKYKLFSGKYSHKKYEDKKVFKFYTKGYFIEENNIFELSEKGYTKGLRSVKDLDVEIDKLLENSVEYLSRELQDNGKYKYGYFPHFDKKINFYNNLRHSSSTYALIEGLSYLNENSEIAEKAIEYLINNYLYEVNGYAHIYDDTKNINEIKLGQNAAFILSVCEYLKYNSDAKNYLKFAQKVAKGILQMIYDNAETIHVLSYPDLSIKENYRIIYYDGEAALALLRLYQIDNNIIWLETVELLFERFIEKKYWKYNDHWLGYCTSELVQIKPKEKYYKFGLQNVSSYLDYIQQRETTFPTYLEMLMATYHLVERAKSTGYSELVREYLDEEKFMRTIHIRAEYQRTGYFYPEIAMYFKNPSRILNSFFIKHHGYRVRIDDIEHYISGYVQYQKIFGNN